MSGPEESVRRCPPTGWLWVVASLIGWGLALTPALPSQVFLRMAFGFLAVFVLPGRLGQVLLRRDTRGLFEDVAHAAALSVVTLALLTIAWMELRLPQASLGCVLLGLGTVGALLGVTRSPGAAPTDLGLTLPKALAVAGIAVLVPVLYAIGGSIAPFPTGEEMLHVGILRKMFNQAIIDGNALLYVPNTPSTYLYAPYHLGLSVLAHLARLDPVTVFIKIRPFYMLVTLSAMYGVLRVLSRRAIVADWGLLVLVIMLLTNTGGQVQTAGTYYYWAQLAPVSHLGDYGLGVLLPLLLYSLARFLAADRLLCEETVTFVLQALATVIIHSRETVQILLYLGIAGVALLASSTLSRERGLMLARIALVALVVVMGARLFLAQHHARVQHAVIYDTALKEQVMRGFTDLVGKPYGGLLEEAPPQSDALILRDLFALGLLLAPLTLLFWPQPWAVFLGATIAGYIVIFRIPWIAYLYCRFTYSEIFMTPVRNVAFQVLLLVALATYVLWSRSLQCWARAAETGAKPRGWLAAGATLAISLGLLGLAPPLLSAWALAHKNLFYLVFALLFAGAVALRRTRLRTWREVDLLAPPPATPMAAQALFMALALSGLLVLAAPPSLRQQYARTGGRPCPQDEQAWYESSPAQADLPYSVLQAMRACVPRGSTVLADYRMNLLLPTMADVYIPHSGFHLSTDLLGFVDAARAARGEPALGTARYEDFDRRRDYSTACLKDSPPVFSAGDTDVQALAFMKGVGVTHLMFDATKHPHLVGLVQRHPECLRVLREEKVAPPATPGVAGPATWYIVEVRGEGIASGVQERDAPRKGEGTPP